MLNKKTEIRLVYEKRANPLCLPYLLISTKRKKTFLFKMATQGDFFLNQAKTVYFTYIFSVWTEVKVTE